jgi:tetratricopeptide (TPR) repeat protein
VWGERFPADPRLAMARAAVAEAQGKPEEGLACVARARSLAPGTGALEAAYVRALTALGRVEEAEAACEAALAQSPDHIGLLKEYIGLATRRGDWHGAVQRALLAQRRRPNDPEVERMVRRAKTQVVGDPEGGSEPTPEAADDTPKPASAALLSRYESLGATTGGCEFGLVQRRFGTEPLGLLRWARIDLEGVITNLLNQFDGMGLPENTQLVVQRASASHQEYFIADSRSGYWTHTFVHVEHAEFDRMYKQSVRRVAFLRSKLLEELQFGNKIYAFKATHRPAEADLFRLHDALCTYGNYRLLIVTLAGSKADIGKLTMIRPGLFVGESGMFMDAGVGRERAIDTELWHYFCDQVAQWCDANPVEAHPAAGANYA